MISIDFGSILCLVYDDVVMGCGGGDGWMVLDCNGRWTLILGGCSSSFFFFFLLVLDIGERERERERERVARKKKESYNNHVNI